MILDDPNRDMVFAASDNAVRAMRQDDRDTFDHLLRSLIDANDGRFPVLLRMWVYLLHDFCLGTDLLAGRPLRHEHEQHPTTAAAEPVSPSQAEKLMEDLLRGDESGKSIAFAQLMDAVQTRNDDKVLNFIAVVVSWLSGDQLEFATFLAGMITEGMPANRLPSHYLALAAQLSLGARGAQDQPVILPLTKLISMYWWTPPADPLTIGVETERRQAIDFPARDDIYAAIRHLARTLAVGYRPHRRVTSTREGQIVNDRTPISHYRDDPFTVVEIVVCRAIAAAARGEDTQIPAELDTAIGDYHGQLVGVLGLLAQWTAQTIPPATGHE